MSFETNCFLSNLVQSQGGKEKMSMKWSNQDWGTSVSQEIGILSREKLPIFRLLMLYKIW